MIFFETKLQDYTAIVNIYRDGELVRNVKIVKGKEYICHPFKKRKPRHLNRRFIVYGFDEFRYVLRAKVRFVDTKCSGFVDVKDINYIS